MQKETISIKPQQCSVYVEKIYSIWSTYTQLVMKNMESNRLLVEQDTLVEDVQDLVVKD